MVCLATMLLNRAIISILSSVSLPELRLYSAYTSPMELTSVQADFGLLHCGRRPFAGTQAGRFLSVTFGDVTTSRQNKRACSALDFRNVPLRG